MGIVGGPGYPQREPGSRIVNLPLEKSEWQVLRLRANILASCAKDSPLSDSESTAGESFPER
jgi:hypothetical protein